MKYITVKLTEDQIYALIEALDGEIELNEPFSVDVEAEKRVAFLNRTQAKLVKSLAKSQEL